MAEVWYSSTTSKEPGKRKNVDASGDIKHGTVTALSPTHDVVQIDGVDYPTPHFRFIEDAETTDKVVSAGAVVAYYAHVSGVITYLAVIENSEDTRQRLGL
jgi:hypothetical protein